jgi:UrcA family protein
MMARNKALLSLITLAGSIALSAPAFAGERPYERTVEVRISDLDLARPSAQAKLQDRISRAVKNVCRSNTSRSIAEQEDVKRCEAEATANAKAQMSERIALHKAQRLTTAASRLKLASD